MTSPSLMSPMGRWFVGILATVVLLTLHAIASPAHAQSRGLEPVAVSDRGGQRVLAYDESHALLIGISNYSGGWSRLPGVETDLREVRSALEAHGFAVTVVRDPDLAGLDAAFRGFIARVGHKPNARLLVYFAGHGHTERLTYGGEMGYLVPRDAPDPRKDRSGFVAGAMSMRTIDTFARSIEAKHALFVFDACFSGAVFSPTRALPEVIQAKTAQPVRQFITSGTAEQKVPDQSVFRDQFVAGLRGEADLDGDGFITGAELGQFLESRVTNYTQQAQTPQYGKLPDPRLDKGDFVFARLGPPLPSPQPAPVPTAPSFDPRQADVAFWQSIQVSTNVADFEDYLKQFPKGQFRSLATRRRDALRQQQVAAAPPPPPAAAPAARPVQPAVGVYPQGPAPGTVFRDCADCPEMVAVPVGSFMMGSPENEQGRSSTEGPQHLVTISRSFSVGKYEVTFDQWDACVAQGGCGGYRPSDFGWGRGARPVINVSWDDAKAYVAWLSRKTGKTYRLLSESEWEYSARGGTTTAWACGAQESCIGEIAWGSSNSGVRTQDVGGKRANAFGLHDMTGNVWEWVEDCYHASYAGAPGDGGAWTTGGDCGLRVLRGGSWNNYPWYLRAANRGRYSTGLRYFFAGFRVARTD